MEKLDSRDARRLGNDRYEGFVVDLAMAIANVVGINLTIREGTMWRKFLWFSIFAGQKEANVLFLKFQIVLNFWCNAPNLLQFNLTCFNVNPEQEHSNKILDENLATQF